MNKIKITSPKDLEIGKIYFGLIKTDGIGFLDLWVYDKIPFKNCFGHMITPNNINGIYSTNFRVEDLIDKDNELNEFELYDITDIFFIFYGTKDRNVLKEFDKTNELVKKENSGLYDLDILPGHLCQIFYYYERYYKFLYDLEENGD